MTTHGNVIGRSWSNGLSQTLTWDAIWAVDQGVRSAMASNNGYDWSAAYDGLGRRLSNRSRR